MRARSTALAAFASLAACGARTPLAGLATDAGFDAVAIDVTDVSVIRPDVPVAFDDVIDAGCSNGLDRLGCVFPDGTRVAFGSTVTRGCVDCRCSESGSLQCVAMRCPQVESDAGAQGCVIPDGRFVSSASWTQVGATWCYCDLGTWVTCRLGPCEDGGTLLSPPPVIGSSMTACNEVRLDPSAVPVLDDRTGSGAPFPRGEPVPPGYYVLRRIETYGAGLSPSLTASAIQVSAASWSIARYTANNRSIERANYDATGESILLQERCPEDTRPQYVRAADGGLVRLPDGGPFLLSGSEPYALRYAMRGAQLLLMTDDRAPFVVFVYSRE